MDVHINLWAVLVAGLSSLVIGALYYADAIYGKRWQKLSKVDKKRFDKEVPKVFPFIFLAALVTAYVVAYVTFLYHAYFQSSWIQAGVASSLILWLGVSATTLFVHNSLDQRPRELTLISMGNRLLSILAMGLLIGWLHP